MINEVSSFYIDIIGASPINSNDRNEITCTYLPLTRINFLTGPGLAVFFLIKEIAFSIFFLVACLFTGFHNQNFKASFLENIQEIPTHLCAIPLGYIGAIIPQTINTRVFHLPRTEVLGILAPSLPQQVS